MWEAGNEERLLNKAIRNYVDSEKAKRPRLDSEIFVDGKLVIVKHVPHILYKDKPHEDIRLMAVLESVLEEIYKGKLEKIPEIIDFNDLLK